MLLILKSLLITNQSSIFNFSGSTSVSLPSGQKPYTASQTDGLTTKDEDEN